MAIRSTCLQALEIEDRFAERLDTNETALIVGAIVAATSTADPISPRLLGPVQRSICSFDDFLRRCDTGVALRHTYADRYSLATPA